MDDKEQAAIDALLAAGLETEAAAVRELRRRHKETMDSMHAAQRDSYKNGRDHERERCANIASGNYGWVNGVYFDDLEDAIREHK